MTTLNCVVCGHELTMATVVVGYREHALDKANLVKEVGWECHKCYAVYDHDGQRVVHLPQRVPSPGQPHPGVAGELPGERMLTAPLIQRLANEDGTPGDYTWTEFGLATLNYYRRLRHKSSRPEVCLELALRRAYRQFLVPRDKDRARQQMKESTIQHLSLITGLMDSEGVGKDKVDPLILMSAVARLVNQARRAG